MNRMISLSVFATALVLGGYMTPASGQSSASDDTAIRSVIVEMTEGFNRHDAKAATSMYTADADFVSVRGDASVGREQVEKGLAAVLTTRAKDAVLKTLNVRVRFLTPDIAVAHVTNELSGLVSPDGRTLPAHNEISIRVFVKEQGAWHVAAFHNTMIAPFR